MDGFGAEYLPISAIQHYAFCPRQFALIYVEQQWIENYLTASGRVMHSRAHDNSIMQIKDSVIIMRGLSLCLDELKLYGVADVVEYHPADSGVDFPGIHGTFMPFPVEYKRGMSKTSDCDRLQLCAQAMCLEYMHDVSIFEGALYYGSPRRRENVTFTSSLKEKTSKISTEMHTMFQSKVTPEPIVTNMCKSCSLVSICQPKAIIKKVQSYWANALKFDDSDA